MMLPYSVQEIADVIGREKALFLIGMLPTCYSGSGRRGGAGEERTRKSTRVIMYVPKRLGRDHRLVRILGWETARALAEAFGGEILQPANCREVYVRFRDRSIRRMVRSGMNPATVAAMMGLSERHVRNLTREIPPEDPGVANDNNRRHLKQAG